MTHNVELPELTKKFIERNKGIATHVILRLHKWMDRKKINLSQLNEKHIDTFIKSLTQKDLAASTQSSYKNTLVRYLTELYVAKEINFYCPELIRKKVILPSYAKKFLKIRKGNNYKRQVERFHLWLDDHFLPLEQLSLSNVESFLSETSKKQIKASSRRVRKYILLPYLKYLYKNKLIYFQPTLTSELPKIAEEFLKELAINLKPTSVQGYTSSLRSFHAFLEKNKIRIDDIQRHILVQWNENLKNKGLHPSTRKHSLTKVRVYLRWLYEQGIINQNPENLIRATDMPKLPIYLPRPIPPKLDVELKKRLKKSKSIYSQGLLLMRNTGLRIGELVSLPFNCIYVDNSNNKFLKVPLGKMNKERLVPLDPDTIKILTRIQKIYSENRELLFYPKNKTAHNIGRADFVEALKKASKGLEADAPITSHRLRHTYATSLMNAGMSFLGIMKLLGHSDHRMTLRYTDISNETIGKEYFQALAVIEENYNIEPQQRINSNNDPIMLLDCAMKTIKKQDKLPKTKLNSILKKLKRIKSNIQKDL